MVPGQFYGTFNGFCSVISHVHPPGVRSGPEIGEPLPEFAPIEPQALALSKFRLFIGEPSIALDELDADPAPARTGRFHLLSRFWAGLEGRG